MSFSSGEDVLITNGVMKLTCIIIHFRMLRWQQFPWDPSLWDPSWRRCPFPLKTTEKAAGSSSRRSTIVHFHRMSKRSWWGRIHLKESSRSKEVITAHSSQSHSPCTKFWLKLLKSHNRSFPETWGQFFIYFLFPFFPLLRKKQGSCCLLTWPDNKKALLVSRKLSDLTEVYAISFKDYIYIYRK